MQDASLAAAEENTPQTEPLVAATDDTSEPEWIGEMESWLPDLEATQPMTAQWLRSIGDAIEAGDEELLAGTWAGVPGEEPPYPMLDEDEQSAAEMSIAARLEQADTLPGGRDQAIMIGIREAAPEKFDEFEAQRLGEASEEEIEDDTDENELEDDTDDSEAEGDFLVEGE